MEVSAGKAIFEKVPPVTVEDLEETKLELDEDEKAALEEFENLWKEFISETQIELPLGKKGESIQNIEKSIIETKTSQGKVHAELQKQSNFFESSRIGIEARYREQIDHATDIQKKELEVLAETLEKLTVSSHNFDTNCPWELFFDCLEEAVDQSGVRQLPGDGVSVLAPSSHAMRPSARAMFLNHAFDENTSPDVSSRDYMLRAYKIDQALLTTEVQALRREIEHHEAANKALDFIGKTLTENNVWGILAREGVGGGQSMAGRSHLTTTVIGAMASS